MSILHTCQSYELHEERKVHGALLDRHKAFPLRSNLGENLANMWVAGAQVKLWTVSSGFCYVTFSEHTGPVTAVGFLPTSAAAVSASMDGTVRAWDLLRYRNFRTMTTPSPVQFASLAVDPAGEVSNLNIAQARLCWEPILA